MITKGKCDIKLHGVGTVGPKGQVVIPKDIRDKLHIASGDSLAFLLKGDRYIGIVKNEDVEDLMEHINSLKK